MHIALSIKGFYWIQILLKENIYLILFFLQCYFFDERSKFSILQFIETKKLKSIHLRMKISLNVIGVKIHRRKKKFVVNKVI